MARQIFLAVMFVASIGFAFWLINFDEMIKAFIGFVIIVGWFYAFLVTCLGEEENQGKKTPEKEGAVHEP